ncbi:MAG: ribonuclease P protein component [Bryobacteraceae bacterium]|nr:ribonuclease P protein component [Bryobacteraceae bacterium]
MRPLEFRRVYDEGVRLPGPLFTAFCLRSEERNGARLGLTIPRAVGKSVVRNRIRRRVREAFRPLLASFPGGWDIVINPRRALLDAEFEAIRQEAQKVLSRCSA